MTGGLIKAGYHEVIVNDATLAVREVFFFHSFLTLWQTMSSRAITFPTRPQIRISSTFFWHLSSDFDLAPIPKLAEQAADTSENQLDDAKLPVYENIKVGQQVQKYVIPDHVSCCFFTCPLYFFIVN